MKEVKLIFKEPYTQPCTWGFWRPMEVEIGFIEDYINQHCEDRRYR